MHRKKAVVDIGSLVDNYTEEELRKIVKESFSMKEVLSKLGYKTLNGRNSDTVKKRIERYQIDHKYVVKIKYGMIKSLQ